MWNQNLVFLNGSIIYLFKLKFCKKKRQLFSSTPTLTHTKSLTQMVINMEATSKKGQVTETDE